MMLKKNFLIACIINLIFFVVYIINPSILANASQLDTYSVNNASDLLWISQQVNQGNSAVQNGNIILNSSIDLSQVSSWKPIGNADYPFQGTFDGNNYTITNLNISTTSDDSKHNGLFGYTKNSVIRSLNIALSQKSEINIEESHIYSGFLVGYNSGTIENCTVQGDISVSSLSSYVYTGLLCGYNTGSINNCSAVGVVSSTVNASYKFLYADAFAGGLAGGNIGTISESNADCTVYALCKWSSAIAGGLVGNNKGIIIDCYAEGVVYSETVFSRAMSTGAYSGGLTGCNTNAIKNSYAKSNKVTSYSGSEEGIADSFSGGLAGYNFGSVENCYSQSADNVFGIAKSPKAATYVGGLIGFSSGTICDSFAKEYPIGASSFDGVIYAGGLLGYNYKGIVKRCYSIGKTYSSNFSSKNKPYSGGLIGYNYYGTVYDCYAKVSTLSRAYSGGLIGENEHGIVRNCYAAGAVSGAYPAGLISENDGFVQKSYYNSDLFGSLENGVGEPTNTLNMKLSETYQNWNFSTFWSQSDYHNDGYPYLNPRSENGLFAGGEGTEEAPFLITTEEELFNICYHLNKHFKLMNDIQINRKWIPLGNINEPFTGTFDGSNCRIYDLSISYEDKLVYSGLFGYVKDCTIKNLRVEIKEGLNIAAYSTKESTPIYAGGIAGYVKNGIIENCSVTGNIYAKAQLAYAGGIAGKTTGTITSCSFSGHINTQSHLSNGIINVGGLLGNADGNISDCSANARVNITSTPDHLIYAGGLIGCLIGDLSQITATGEITLTGTDDYSHIGDIAGYYVIGNLTE